MWQTLFSLTNVVAVLGWTALLVLPRAALVRSAIMFAGVGLLCLVYVVLFALLISGSVDPAAVAGSDGGMKSYSIAGIRGLFLSDGGIVLGWTHYLAFDLFTGLWIASDADNKGYSRFTQAPFLVATFLAGPIGLFFWLLIRERRARAVARAAGGR
ncbi:ABA4-like family protein [Novosphingobium aquiterrae]|uniref:ABA4-like family protein n=1 Tax=Novosphingobium aquiterrae TaxID=624388 RepID=A0ABV6PLA8_9SPHN